MNTTGIWLSEPFSQGQSCQVEKKNTTNLKDFSGRGSTEAKARTVSKKALKTPGNQADNLLSL